jgi:hypothetical protein
MRMLRQATEGACKAFTNLIDVWRTPFGIPQYQQGIHMYFLMLNVWDPRRRRKYTYSVFLLISSARREEKSTATTTRGGGVATEGYIYILESKGGVAISQVA